MKALYDDPERYAELAGFEGGYRDLWHDQGFLRMLGARLRITGARSVLDVGCGAAHWGRAVVKHMAPEATLTGVDREPHFLRLAAAARPRGPAAEQFVRGDVEALPFDDDTFDVVTCQTVLIHVPDLAKAVAEMVRVARPGGTILLAEPDNRAGNLALLGGEPRLPDEDVLAIVELMMVCERGKLVLGEGDQSVGPRLPGTLAAAGAGNVVALDNPRCIYLYPPYEEPHMKVVLDQERAWHAEGVSALLGSRHDNLRFYLAAGGSESAFDRGWASVLAWTEQRLAAVDAGTHHAARGFVFYYVCGTKSAGVDQTPATVP
jgi:SAM-dependent methyltransferase